MKVEDMVDGLRTWAKDGQTCEFETVIGVCCDDLKNPTFRIVVEYDSVPNIFQPTGILWRVEVLTSSLDKIDPKGVIHGHLLNGTWYNISKEVLPTEFKRWAEEVAIPTIVCYRHPDAWGGSDMVPAFPKLL